MEKEGPIPRVLRVNIKLAAYDSFTYEVSRPKLRFVDHLEAIISEQQYNDL